MKAPIKVHVTFSDGEFITYEPTEVSLNAMARTLVLFDEKERSTRVINLEAIRYYKVIVEDNNG